MDKKTKKILIWSGVTLALLIIIIIVARILKKRRERLDAEKAKKLDVEFQKIGGDLDSVWGRIMSAPRDTKYNPKTDSKEMNTAMKGTSWCGSALVIAGAGTCEETIHAILGKLSAGQIRVLNESYINSFGRDLPTDWKDELSKDDLKIVTQILAKKI